MSARIKVLRIYCCEDCPALSATNYCNELERWSVGSKTRHLNHQKTARWRSYEKTD
jgi:hypothetical protein